MAAKVPKTNYLHVSTQYTACAPTFPWILIVFVVHVGLRYIGLGPTAVHLSRPHFTAVRPENGSESTKNQLSMYFSTNAVFATTFPCISHRTARSYFLKLTYIHR